MIFQELDWFWIEIKYLNDVIGKELKVSVKLRQISLMLSKLQVFSHREWLKGYLQWRNDKTTLLYTPSQENFSKRT